MSSASHRDSSSVNVRVKGMSRASCLDINPSVNLVVKGMSSVSCLDINPSLNLRVKGMSGVNCLDINPLVNLMAKPKGYMKCELSVHVDLSVKLTVKGVSPVPTSCPD